MKRVKAIIDCGVTSIVISPSLLAKLKLPRDPVFTSNNGHNGLVMMSAQESRKAGLLVQYIEHSKLGDILEGLVVSIEAYNPVLGLAWFNSRNSEIDWTKGWLTGLRTQNVRNERRFQKEIAQVLFWNAVRKAEMMRLPQIYDHSGLPDSMIC
jgi:hypothetical protein